MDRKSIRRGGGGEERKANESRHREEIVYVLAIIFDRLSDIQV
jgi:hypothetical protein